MANWKKLLSVLVAALMLFTMPITTGIARAVAEGTTEPTESGTPSESIELEVEEMDPAQLHVHKLGEVDEEEGDGFDPAELEITDLNKIVRVSIFLDEKSTIEKGYEVQSSGAKSYREKLRKQQDTLQAKIEQVVGHELTVKWNLTLLANAISVEIPYKDVALIRGMEGVKSVELETQYEAPKPVDAEPNTANTSANMVGAQYAWNTLGYTGAGTRVAIIDTGLDTNHQSVNNDAFLHAIDEVRAGGKTVTLMDSIPSGLNGAGVKISDKIPFGYNYVDTSTRVNHQDSGSNHGSHVAGIAAANRYIKNGSNYDDAITAVGAVGMAPDAQILVMKVFGTNGGAYDSDYFAAIEDAVVLEADACNLSLGSGAPGYTYASSSYQAILNDLVNKENLHMVLSISAGNSYAADQFTSHKLYAEDASFHTGGSPGSYVHSMGVAAAQNTLTTGTPLMFNGSQQVFYGESTEDSDGNTYTNPKISTIAGSYSFVYIDATGEAEDYSTVNSAVSLSGKIVIINRGDISFSEKGNNAKSYNPKALIVANNDDGTILMNLADYTGTFPMVTITLKDANTIKENSTSATTGGITYYTGTVQVTTTEVSTVTPREDAEITDFSSWGVPGSLLMKPEITAPGGDIYSINGTSSSDSGSGTDQYISYSGTSMAAPHITGLSAVLMQYLRENAPDNADLMSGYNLRAIANSLLMSTATPMINQGAFLSILQQGAGLVEVSKAIEAKSVIMMDEAYLTSETNAAADGKVKVELGDDPEKAGEYTYKFTIYNITDKTLEFELGTILFTQAVSGDTLSRKTAILPLGGDTYEWNGQAPAEEHDVNKDGKTDEEDAQAILELVSGNLEEDDENYDFTVADMDGDGTITSRDAKLLLDWEGSAAQEGYFVGPNDKAQVTVHINLTAEQKAALEKEGGAWLEGYTYVDCVTADQEGVSYEHEHTIPILGYFGSFTDASMFDTNSYTENLYGNDQLNYSGNAATSTNYMRITTNGTLAKFSGNPYMVEENGFPAERLAIRSDAKINDIAYNMIRNAGGTGFAVTKLDDNGDVSDIVYSTVTGQSVEGLWYYVNGGTWQNTMTKTYNVNKALNEYSGINEGDRVRVGFYAIPEYNVMKVSGDMTAADAGTLTASRFTQILTDNVLGKGAFVGFDFTVDDTAPTFTSNPTLDGSTLTVYASDDQNLAYVGILSLDGSVIYKQVAPGTPTAEVSIDATDAIANAQGYVAVFIADYAGNEAAYAVKVNNNTHVEKTVYVLTSTVTAGDDYLIMNRNSAGAGYALYYTLNSSQTTATSGAVATAVQAGTADTNGQPYVESADVAATSVWTAGTGSTNGTFTFNNNGWYLRRSGTNALTITKDTSRRDWTWNGTNNRLSINSRYLRYYNNNFSLNTATNSVYMYVKTTISYEVDPYSVMSVTVSPATLDLYRGDTASLTAKVAPLTATDRSVTWSSDNPSIATVSDVGVVTAVAAGTTTIKATSNADPTKFGECHVTVVAINKELSAAVWDEEGDVYFSYFNANNLPTWTKRHNTGTGVEVTSAMMASTSDLYAATNDLSTSYIYTVNRTSYAMTQLGENYVVPFGMATVGTSFGGTSYFVYAFAKYLIFGNLQPEADDEYGTYCGFPYGLLDLSETDVGDAYAVAICCRNKSTTSAGYYFLDETGKIWQTNQSYSSSGISFSNPTFVYDTGITAGLQYNSIYFDGTHLYWTHQDGDYAELYILANANDSSNRKFYRAGNFGENIWPVAGLYTNGSLAPASVEPGDEIMSEELVGTLNLKPLMSREELMTPDIMARFAAEAAKNNSKGAAEAVNDEPIELPEMPNEEPVVEPEEPEDGEHRAHILHTVTGVATEGVIPFSESVASENGLFAVVYDPETLTLTDNAKGTADNLYVAIHVDTENGIVTVAYAMKGETPLAANTPIATLTFEAQTCGEGESTIEVDTRERGEDLELNEQEEIPFPALDHIWGTPTYEWTQVENGWTCTATRVCERNSEHVETETVTAVRTETADKAVYTATFENEAFEEQVKEVDLGYYLVGSVTSWAVDTTKKFEVNADNASEYLLQITLAAGDEFKAVKAEGTTIIAWYPDQGTNYVVGTNQAGDVTVFFRPDGQGGDGWHYGYLYIATQHVHIWSEPTYEWAADNSTVTATRSCTECDEIETETVSTTLTTVDATCTEAGSKTWTSAAFENPMFEVQTKTETIPATGHDWDEPTYEWAADNSTVTATRVCANDATHVETETVNTTSEVKTPATCEGAGTTTYTATFENEAFETQTKDVENLEPIGHDWDTPTYTWDENNNCTAERVCKNDATHKETELAPGIGEVTKPATCEEAGETTYTATFANEAFEPQTKVVADVEPIGHDWDEPTYEWAADNSTVTATRVCKNDESHVETETVNTRAKSRRRRPVKAQARRPTRRRSKTKRSRRRPRTSRTSNRSDTIGSLSRRGHGPAWNLQRQRSSAETTRPMLRLSMQRSRAKWTAITRSTPQRSSSRARPTPTRSASRWDRRS